MNDVVTSILTDSSVRDSATIEDVLLQQAVAQPWYDAPAA